MNCFVRNVRRARFLSFSIKTGIRPHHHHLFEFRHPLIQGEAGWQLNRCFATQETPVDHGENQYEYETDRKIQDFLTGNPERLAKTSLKEVNEILEDMAEEASGQRRGLPLAWKAEDILKKLELESERYPHLIPNICTYNHVMHIFATCGGKQAAEQAEAILTKLVDNVRQHAESDDQELINATSVYPMSNTFNIAMDAWGRSGGSDAAQQSERIFSLMEDWAEECRSKHLPIELPNVRSLCAVIQAWGRNETGIYGRKRVRAILDVVMKRYRAKLSGSEGTGVVIKPNIIMFNSALHACTQNDQSPDAAERAEDILKMVEEAHESYGSIPVDESDPDDVGIAPTTTTFTSLINTWARVHSKSEVTQRYCAERAEAILNQMIDLYQKGYDVKPNEKTYATVITAWGKVRSEKGFSRAEAIFDSVLEVSQRNPDDLEVNSHIVNAFITSAVDLSMNQASLTLEKLLNLDLADTITFNILLNEIAGKGDAGEAVAILERLENHRSLSPDETSYNTVLKAIAKSKFSGLFYKNAAAIISTMEKGNVKPTSVTYTTYMTVLSKSSHPLRVEKAREILDRMMDQYSRTGHSEMKPDVAMFTSFIATCAGFHGDQHQNRATLRQAIRSFDEMKSNPDLDDPNHRTYYSLMRAAKTLAGTRQEQIRLLLGLFRRCVGDGKLNRKSLEIFQRVIPKNILHQERATEGMSIPYAWSMNVPKREQPNQSE